MAPWTTFPGATKYQVNQHGEIRNAATRRLVTQHSSNGGYKRVSLMRTQRRITISVHRVMALTFLPNPEAKPTVNHKNHDAGDNRLENLEWATITEQNRHKRKCVDQTHASARPVRQLDHLTGALIAEHASMQKASDALDPQRNAKSKICAAARGKRKTAYGFIWEYADAVVVDGEIWKPLSPSIIDGIEGYHISTHGRVKNHHGRVTVGHNHHSGYLWVSVHPKQYLLHVLVAKTFLPNPEGKRVVNHKDNNRANACLANLEWMTDGENVMHGKEAKRMRMTV